MDDNKDGQVDADAGKEWCFLYGGEEWVNPGKKEDKTYMKFSDYENQAKVDSSKRVVCENYVIEE